MSIVLDCLIGVAKKIGEPIVDKAIAESRHLFCYTCIVEEFEKEKKKLITQRDGVGQRVGVITNRGEDVQVTTLDWELLGEVEKLEKEGLPARLPGVERYSSKDYILFQSRELNFDQLFNALLDDKNYITVLHGAGGIGKTTLAIEDWNGGNLQRLETLELVSCKDVKLPPEIKKLEKLSTKEPSPHCKEATFKYLVQEAEVLRLEGINGGWRNLMPDIVPIYKGMNDLIELQLTSSSQLQCLIDTRHVNSHEQNVFAELVILELKSMENLEQLCNGPFPSDFLRSLQSLIIENCNNLRNILFKSKLNLDNLKILKVGKCN
ncbi:P-loop containing nucleoside triphosphate hydrolase [Sesbania bispinosa]|nr:P-loop containing nucleoside triphosphate hydrolase [Sesbania bispinosa]